MHFGHLSQNGHEPTLKKFEVRKVSLVFQKYVPKTVHVGTLKLLIHLELCLKNAQNHKPNFKKYNLIHTLISLSFEININHDLNNDCDLKSPRFKIEPRFVSVR